MKARPDSVVRVSDPMGWLHDEAALDAVVATVAHQVLRTDLSRSGFFLLDLDFAGDPQTFRTLLVKVQESLDRHYQRQFGRRLLFRSAGRFDQRSSTEAHRDGAPEESLLVLGYEPTPIVSQLSLLDHTACAHDRGLTPVEFLDRMNPMFPKGRDLLVGYTWELPEFREPRYRIVFINNSTLPVERADTGMLGVLHKAVMLSPTDRERHVNSIVLVPAALDTWPGHTDADVERFVATGATFSV